MQCGSGIESIEIFYLCAFFSPQEKRRSDAVAPVWSNFAQARFLEEHRAHEENNNLNYRLSPQRSEIRIIIKFLVYDTFLQKQKTVLTALHRCAALTETP